MRNIIQDTLRLSILVLFTLLILLLIISCEKEIVNVGANEDQLPLVGIWDWLYSQDPRTSEIYTPETRKYSHHLMFSGDSIALFFYNDSLSKQCIYHISSILLRDGTTNTFIKLCDESPSPLVYNDTLRLSYAATDGYIDYYLRRKILGK